MSDGEVICGLSVVSGEQPGLSSKWKHGTARFLPNEILFGNSPVLSLGVRRILGDEQRVPHGAELWRVSPDCLITPIVTDTALLEIALLASDSISSLRRLGEGSRP